MFNVSESFPKYYFPLIDTKSHKTNLQFMLFKKQNKKTQKKTPWINPPETTGLKALMNSDASYFYQWSKLVWVHPWINEITKAHPPVYI